MFCILVGSQHFQYDLPVRGPKGLVSGLSKDFVSALEGLYLPQLRGRSVVNWGHAAVVIIAIDVDSSFFFLKKKKKFRWRTNGLPLYDAG